MKQKIEQFLAYLDERKHAAEKTMSSYKRELMRLNDYIKRNNIKFENINQKHIRHFIYWSQNKKFKRSTIRVKVSALRSFFDYCDAKSWIDGNPARNVELPKVILPMPSFLTESEMKLLLPTPIIALRDYAVLEILYATGVIAKELTTMNINDLDLLNKEIRVRGTKKSRIVFFGEKALKSLIYYLQVRPLLLEEGNTEEALFLNRYGRRLSHQGLGRIIKKYEELSGLHKKITPQTLRNSFISHMLGRGAKSWYVQELLGHKRIESTERYKKINYGYLEEVHKKYLPISFKKTEGKIQPFENPWNTEGLKRFIRY